MRSWLTLRAWLPIPVFMVVIGILAFLRVPETWNPMGIISTLNIHFLAIISLVVSLMAAKSYRAGRSTSVLLLGNGTLALGLGGMGAALYLAGSGANANAAVFDTMACIAGSCHIASAMTGLTGKPGRVRWGMPMLLASYLAIVAMVAALILLVRWHAWPIHFIEGSGATAFGDTVLWTGAILFALSALLLLANRAREEASFRHWYGLGLGLIALGLIGVSFQTNIGDPVNWASRLSQYLGAIYMLAAVASSIGQNGKWMLPLEEALRESERKSRAIFDQTLQLMGLLAPDGTVLEANRASLEFIEAGEADVIGRPFWETPWWTHSPEMQARLQRAVKVAAGGKIDRFEATHRTRDGRLFYFDFSLKPVVGDDGDVVFLIPEGRDVTERKRVEEARERLLKEVEEQRARLQAIVDSLSAAVWIADPAGNMARVNDVAGFTSGGRAPHVDHIGEEGAYEAWWADTSEPIPAGDMPMARAIRGETCKGMAIDFLRSDGTHGVQLVSAVPIRSSKGTITGGVAIVQDISGMKQREKEFKAAKAQAELYLDLMGHDINNIHQIALGYIELARDAPAGEDRARFLDKSIEVLQRSALLIQNVKKIQKLQDGVLEARDIDVCKVLGDVQREFGAAPNKRIVLNTNGHERCPVRANELLHDVFANLVGNAIKHTGDRADIVVDVDIVADNGIRYCRVMVEDDGPGVPDDFKVKIFNRALKGTGRAKGMGLGLYLVKSLADSYGGLVWVEDRVKGDHTRGARFVIMLPAAGDDQRGV